jgi:hypothetical protein
MLTGAPVTDEMIKISKTKYMPAIRAMGCIDCVLVRTGPDSSLLIATYADKAAADAAVEKAAALRAQSGEEFGGAAQSLRAKLLSRCNRLILLRN